MTSTITSLLTAVTALTGVLALILLTAKLARGRGMGLRPPDEAAHLQRNQTLAIDPRRRVHLLDCAGQPVLLLTGGPSDIMLLLRNTSS